MKCRVASSRRGAGDRPRDREENGSWRATVPLVLGVNVAHGGADRTRIIDRRGRRMGHRLNETLNESDEMVIAGHLARAIERLAPDAVFVDVTGGYGAGVVDRLRERNYRIVRGVNFGARAADRDTYANKRAEMWAALKDWLAEGADVVDDETLQAHLSAPTARPDSSGRLILEAKDDLRRRLGFSPDGGDAAALTFAHPVRRRDLDRSLPERAEGGYDPLGW